MKVLYYAAALIVPAAVAVASMENGVNGDELAETANAGELQQRELNLVDDNDWEDDEDGLEDDEEVDDRELERTRSQKRAREKEKKNNKRAREKEKRQNQKDKEDKGTKKKPKGISFSKGCQTFEYKIKKKDIEKSMSAANTTIKAFDVPLYEKSKKVGTFSAGLVGIENGKRDTMIGNAVMSFNKNTLISLYWVSTAKILPITGSTGKVQCGSGQVTQTPKSKKIGLEGYLCSLC